MLRELNEAALEEKGFSLFVKIVAQCAKSIHLVPKSSKSKLNSK